MAYVRQTPHHAAEPKPSAEEPFANHRAWPMGGAVSTEALAPAPAPQKALSEVERLVGSMDCVQQRRSGNERKARRCAGRSDGLRIWQKHCWMISHDLVSG